MKMKKKTVPEGIEPSLRDLESPVLTTTPWDFLLLLLLTHILINDRWIRFGISH